MYDMLLYELLKTCLKPPMPEDFIFKNESEANNNENAAGNASSSASNKQWRSQKIFYGSKEEKEIAETNVCLDLNLSLSLTSGKKCSSIR
ncbi:BnaA08g26440D [Brassica napus]|uniref:(rape) hypothetical protein n=1 Tax=Brassica napus TaxID=3708 RepID=A0A078H115_BRANA|nr:unnamed protein product [Brassica napus]CDY31094.1 BnaA08g26440D [Brassica napus]